MKRRWSGRGGQRRKAASVVRDRIGGSRSASGGNGNILNASEVQPSSQEVSSERVEESEQMAPAQRSPESLFRNSLDAESDSREPSEKEMDDWEDEWDPVCIT